MKRLLTGALVVLALTAGGLAADEKTEWVKVTPKDDNCEISFPTKPKETPGQWVAEALGGKAALLLLINKLPDKVDIDKADTVKTILDKGRDAGAKQLKGKVVSDKELKVNKKYPARDIDIEAPGLGIYRTRLILTPNKLYQVTVLGPKDWVDGAEAKKFMSSFKMTD